jgi:sugar lactone lactonase YvrE
MKSGQKTRCWSLWIAFTVLLSFSRLAYSTETEIWKISSFDEFRQGEADNISLTSTGKLLLAPQTDKLLTLKDQDIFVWALAQDSQGNLYAGTGEQGKIFKITPGGEMSLFFDSPEINILSLAIDAANNVYAGSAPDGLIYKITPEGSPTTFFSTEEHYVWTLTFDANAVLYAGTGESGKIFTILPDGAGTVLYDSPQTHVMSLLYDARGWLYAGTEGKGVTYKIGLDGKAFSLYQAEEEEIHSLVLDKQGNLYIGALSNKFFPKPEQAPAPTEQQPSPKQKRLKKSSIYRMNPAGTITKILELPETLIYAMVIDAQDQLMVGTDEKGVLYRVFPDGEYHQILTMKTGNIISLLRDASDRVYVGTGDAGMVYRFSAQTASQGSYLSPVHDAKTTATWGQIFWEGTADHIALFTRTGNTAVPDDTWSDWSAEFRNQEGNSLTNPPARFIQWKAMLTSQEQQSPTLEEVSVAYLPHNLPPEISQVVLYYPTQDGQPNPENPGNQAPQAPGKKEPPQPQEPAPLKPPKFIPPGYIAVVWDAKDPNNEDLLFSVSFRGEGEENWKVLEEELETPLYMLDTWTLPDGEYSMKITATDSPDNPPDQALTAEKISARFTIDNTAPEVSIAFNQQQENTVLVTVIAQDKISHLQSAEYAVDAGKWIPVFPEDGVTDSRAEKYTISLPDLKPDEHIIAVRVMDTRHNVGVAKLVFSTKPAPTTETKTSNQGAQ